jgi:hypothetical protein
MLFFYVIISYILTICDRIGEFEYMSSLDKMWASFVAMGLMVLASLLITYARQKTHGALRLVLSIIAFLIFIPILIYMLVSML